MRLLNPDLLQWWLVVPVLVASCAVHWRLRRAFRDHSTIHRRFAALSRRSTWKRDAGVLVVSVLAAAAIVAAIVRPQVLASVRVPDYERQDLIVMLDRSASMRARDIAPSRFARATLELRNLIRRKPEGIDRIGLVGFADSSLVLSYLTADVDSLVFYLDWLDRDDSVLFGTNIGSALTSAMDVAGKDDRPTPKRFLLVSDGEDQGSELKEAVATLRNHGYRVDCIGIGSGQAVPIPLDESSYLQDDAGRRVTTTFNQSTLVQIAEATGGKYLRSTSGTELARALSDITGGDRQVRRWRISTEYRDLYPILLGAGALAVAALCILV